MSNLGSGEIVHAGQILYPPLAEAMGSAVLGFHREAMESQNETVDSFGLYTRLQCSGLLYDYINNRSGIREENILIAAENRFREILFEKGVTTELTFSADLCVGYLLGDIWHTDNKGYRLIVNLADHPRKLLKANSVENEGTSAEEITELTTVTGAGLFLDNYCEEQSRIKHSGVWSPNGVLLRLFAIEAAQS